MIRDTFFSGSRFMNLLWKEVKENWKTYVIFTATMFGIMIIIHFLFETSVIATHNSMNGIDQASLSHYDRTGSMILFICLLFVFGSSSASAIMDKMKTKTGRTAFLLLPATSFEKFFTRWLIYTIAFLIIYYIIFVLADYAFVAIYSWYHPDYDIVVTDLRYIFKSSDTYYGMGMPYSMFAILIAVYFYVQSFFVLGGTVCPKKSFLRTFVAGLVLLFIYLSTIPVYNKFLMPFGAKMDGQIIADFINNTCRQYLLGIVIFLMALLNWIIAYYRFKESEIIHRLL
ncbi:hypothetical protein EZS27_021751 [termite gut metagenome]|uniref:Uncharacterized protein n=1 Tax=termite gut metagenome TaxID=433724 RepID=A0A5J4R8Z5_9ZZZZ